MTKKSEQMEKMGKVFGGTAVVSGFMLTVLTAISILAPAMAVYADRITLNITSTGYYVQMTSDTGDELAMNLASGSGNVSSVTDRMTVKTNVKNGYNVYLSTTTDDNSLKMASAPSGAAEDKTKIAPLTGSVSNNAFAMNKWGYSVNDGTSWSAVPPKGQEVKIKGETAPTSSEGTTFEVKYGAKVDASIMAGVYSGAVLYTVVADGSSTNLKGYTAPTHIDTGTKLTVTVPLYANYNVNGGEVKVSVGGKLCGNVQVIKQDKNRMIMTCDAPEKVNTEEKQVLVSLPKNNEMPIDAGKVRYN